jgi:hypothetical protein
VLVVYAENKIRINRAPVLTLWATWTPSVWVLTATLS